MKKIILSMVFVLGIFTMGNANTSINKISNDNVVEIINPDEDYCSDLYFEVRDMMLDSGHSLHVSISAAIAAESACGDEMPEIIE